MSRVRKGEFGTARFCTACGSLLGVPLLHEDDLVAQPALPILAHMLHELRTPLDAIIS